MMAYDFISKYYNDGDSICLFGFSRGANQCRILASIIYTIGIIDLSNIKEESDKDKLLLNLYDLYITTASAHKKKQLATFINNWELSHHDQTITYDTSGTKMIELIGLWDTVEALIYNDELETGTPVPQHLNQLCNVKRLFHAVSLDDNRAFNYTPILATNNDVALSPGQDINEIVEEVWFNGSHKDVGGGVRFGKKKDRLSGISLNWMWSKVKDYNIFPNPEAFIDTFGKVHDMRASAIVRMTSPGDSLRGINKYWEAMNPNWNNHRIKVHRSVIARLDSGMVQNFKLKYNDTKARQDWYDWEPFWRCFTKVVRNGIERIEFNENNDCLCIQVVNDSIPDEKVVPEKK